MTKPRNYQTEAIIIKKARLGEADRILTLYTPHLGKIQAVAKGVRRPRSKMSGHLELLTHSLIPLARGRNIDTVTGSQTINSFLPLKSELWLNACALYATELINLFTADHIENEPLFQLLLDTLQRLCQSRDTELTLRYFEIHLLDNVGYRPQLRECTSCHSPLKETVNIFSPGAGGMLCPDCSESQFPRYTVSVNALKALRLFQDSDYDIAKRLRLNPALSAELERIMKLYFKYLLERDIKSALWLDTLRQHTGRTTPGQITLL